MPPLDGHIDAASVAENLVPLLLQEMYGEQMSGRQEIPMAALCKRLGIRMSTLQRYLTMLESHGLVTVHCDDAGRWTTLLTVQGLALFDSLAA
jgi:DNA-binding IclR family transcriptional regulator